MSLDIRNRPDTLKGFAGNKSTVAALENLFAKGLDKFPHAILITGPTGCGKTTLGRIIAKRLNAYSDDYREIDSAQFNGIDTIREIQNQMRFRQRHPDSDCRVWLIDEAHMLGTGGASEKNKAQNAILKMLEESPQHVYFILCTTDPQRLLKTVRGRCTTLEVATLKDNLMENLLKRVTRKEGGKISDDIREMIVRKSNGHPRNALKMLEKVIGLSEEDAEVVLEEEERVENETIELCRALVKKYHWNKIAKILKGLKDVDEEKIRRMILGYFNTIILNGKNDQAFAVMEEMEEPFYNTGKPGLTMACYRIYLGPSEYPNEDVPF